MVVSENCQAFRGMFPPFFFNYKHAERKMSLFITLWVFDEVSNVKKTMKLNIKIFGDISHT